MEIIFADNYYKIHILKENPEIVNNDLAIQLLLGNLLERSSAFYDQSLV